MKTGYLRTTLALLAVSAVVSCQARDTTAPQKKPGSGAPRVAREVELLGYSIHRVALAHPHRVRGADGREREIGEAYLVRLEMILPRPGGPAMELYVGETRIREYGGWKGGLYFKLYEASELKRLAGGEVSWRWPERERVASGRRLEVDDMKALSLEDESDVLGR